MFEIQVIIKDDLNGGVVRVTRKITKVVRLSREELREAVNQTGKSAMHEWVCGLPPENRKVVQRKDTEYIEHYDKESTPPQGASDEC